jgi:uncharacterized protein with GYD domain
MPRYMAQAAYTPEHFASLTRDPDNRAADVGDLAQDFGCRLVSFYYSFGEYDAVIVVEAPDETAMTALMLAALGAGHIRASKTTQLIAPEAAVEAMRQAGAVAFKAPGGPS